MDVEDLHAAQTARWRAADPLLPPPVRTPGDPLRVPDGAGWPRYAELDPTAAAATWTALRHHGLTAQVAGDDPAAALGGLLDLWEEELAEPDDPETVAEVVWPSRDTAPVLALARHGFAPTVVVAAGRTGYAEEADAEGVDIRPAGAADMELAVAFNLEIVRYDQQFGALGERPSTADRLAEAYARYAEREVPTVWLAERDGRPVGMCAVDLPENSVGSGALCSAPRVGYLGAMYVDPAERGAGVGSALHAHADAALAAAGAMVTLLHHALPNPRSTPFWYQHGYRPLWTHWQRRPAVRTPSAPPT